VSHCQRKVWGEWHGVAASDKLILWIQSPLVRQWAATNCTAPPTARAGH